MPHVWWRAHQVQLSRSFWTSQREPAQTTWSANALAYIESALLNTRRRAYPPDTRIDDLRQKIGRSVPSLGQFGISFACFSPILGYCDIPLDPHEEARLKFVLILHCHASAPWMMSSVLPASERRSVFVRSLKPLVKVSADSLRTQRRGEKWSDGKLSTRLRRNPILIARVMWRACLCRPRHVSASRV